MPEERVLFDGQLPVDYGQAYVASSWEPMPEVVSTVLGQHNGLCGSRHRGFLFLVTGRRYGPVGFRTELLPREPVLSEQWEDVVEVPFTALTADVNLLEWGGNAHALPIQPGRYRVRYSGRDLDAGREADPSDRGVIDSYLLQFWPDDTTRPDAVLKETSDVASYWHGVAQE